MCVHVCGGGGGGWISPGPVQPGVPGDGSGDAGTGMYTVKLIQCDKSYSKKKIQVER
jgi:hypothetical protein